MKIQFYIFIILSFLMSHLSAQNNIDLTSLPDVSDLSVVRSNPGADTVILALHGGPLPELRAGQFNILESIPTISLVEVMQYTHLHPEVFSYDDLRYEEGLAMHDTSVAILRKVVHHYLDLDKKVVLLGHSLGAFLILEYLDDYGADGLSSLVMASGRLKVPDIIIHTQINGGLGRYSCGDDEIIILDEDESYIPIFKILGSIMTNNYLDSLQGLDLSRCLFIDAEFDEATGSLSPEEVNFIYDQDGHLITYIGANHSAANDDLAQMEALKFIRGQDYTRTFRFDLFDIITDFAKADVRGHFLNFYTWRECDVTVFDFSGRLVHNERLCVGNHYFDYGHLSTGNYILKFVNDDNEIIIQKIFLP